MVKRLFDVVISSSALVLLAPVFIVVAGAIRLSDPGPVFRRTRRVGLRGEMFDMLKFRTMYVEQGPSPNRLTSPNDPRVFPLGALLRRLKVDEFPQLLHVLSGRMSLVGPRPEDPFYVMEHYSPEDMETLEVLPGLTSPATLYNYTHGDEILARGDVEQMYLEKLLPVRMELERLYVREASFFYDLRIIFRTIVVMALVAFGRQDLPTPPELRRLGLDAAGPPRRSREPGRATEQGERRSADRPDVYTLHD